MTLLLTPLEIGMHALWAVPLSKGGRGVTGGLSEYAERIGREKSAVSMLRSAAQVAETVQLTEQFPVLDKATHLYEISRAPRQSWPVLVAALSEHGWTVAETSRKAADVKRFDIPDRHAPWLETFGNNNIRKHEGFTQSRDAAALPPEEQISHGERPGPGVIGGLAVAVGAGQGR